MMKFLVLFFAASIVASAKPHKNDEELIFVHALWRHGDRAPNFAWSTDPNQENAWPQGFGSLSRLGMHQHFQLGKRLRQELGDFVSRNYLASEIYVRSSDFNRTLASATSNMIGFFNHEQKEGGKDFPNDLEWPMGFVPIPIHTVNIENDYLKSMPDHCSRINFVKKTLKHTKEYKKLADENTKLLKTLSDLTGLDVRLKDTFHIHDTLFIEKTNNKSWSPGITEEIYDKLGELAKKYLNLKYGIGVKPHKKVDFDVELPKLNGGFILWEMINRMQDKIACMEKPMNNGSCNWIDKLRYFAYSGHEESITSAFRTYGLKKTNFNSDGMPTYASCLLVELYKNSSNGVYFIKIKYLPRDEPTLDITNQIAGCEKGCTLDEFARRSEKYKMLPNADAVCNQ